MPLFTPDLDRVRSKLGRPWALWWTTAWYESVTLVLRDGTWKTLEAPTEEELVGATLVFQQRENWVSYEDVRTHNLTSLGAVRYVDDYDDQWTDVYISQANEPFDRATEPEPVWDEE